MDAFLIELDARLATLGTPGAQPNRYPSLVGKDLPMTTGGLGTERTREWTVDDADVLYRGRPGYHSGKLTYAQYFADNLVHGTERAIDSVITVAEESLIGVYAEEAVSFLRSINPVWTGTMRENWAIDRATEGEAVIGTVAGTVHPITGSMVEAYHPFQVEKHDMVERALVYLNAFMPIGGQIL